MRFIIWCLLFSLLTCKAAVAQQDSIPTEQTDSTTQSRYQQQYNPAKMLLDSIASAERAREQFVSDSLAMLFIKRPDSLRHNQFVDSMLKVHLYRGQSFLDIPVKTKSLQREGHGRRTRDPWIIIIITALFLYTALLNRTMSKDVSNVLQSFYSKRVFSQVSREDSLLNSWAFIGLFILFGLTFGLFLYQISSYYDVFYSISGVQLFISLALLIIILFAAKLLLLRFIGFVFNINRLVGEYISILYLTYFNITFVFLPLSVCFSLLSAKFIPYVLAFALFLVVVIFIWQYLRSSVDIISSFRFHKFYLFIYLCALEICPILILIKALNIYST